MKAAGRYIALDVGAKRTGLAVTDVLAMVASPVSACPTHELMDRLEVLIDEEACAGLVVGDPKQLDGGASDNSALVHRIIGRLKEQFKEIPVFLQDERFTSKMAVQAMIEAGVPKQKRREKERVDSMSAAIILQSFLDKKKSS